VTIPVLDNDVDDDGPVTLCGIDEPANGDAVMNPDGTVTYTPDPGFTGTDYFNYEGCDHDGASSEALVTVVVTAPINNVSFQKCLRQNCFGKGYGPKSISKHTDHSHFKNFPCQ